MTAILKTRGLTKRFGGLTALNDVNLDVEEGSIHAVIGPNGSGKTTLFNIVSGIYQPTSGEIEFLGQPVRKSSPDSLARRGLGRTFQNTRLFSTMTVRENVLAILHASSGAFIFDARRQTEADRLLDFVGLSGVAHDSSASLPQGQRRLLEIAKVLALSPKIVLLDEPHGGLNETETARLIELIRKIQQSGLTVLLIEHEMNVVMKLAHNITVLNFGSVLRHGTPAEVRQDPAVVEAYLGTVNAAEPRAATPARTSSKPLLEVRNISVRFGDIEAVRDVSLTVGEGEIVTLLGNNGAGKSSTLKAISRMANVARGDVSFEGRSLLKVRTDQLVGQGIAVVPERRRLFGGLTVIENLKIGAYGRNPAYVETAMQEVLTLLPGLQRHKNSFAFQLSGGEQQMLAIGRALMSRPKLLLLDEPSLGLAPLVIEQVFKTLEDVNRKGTALLLVEQNAALALAIADRAYVLNSGRITVSGPAAALAEDAKLKEAYLGGEAELA